jgi:hypothetical protein
MSKIKGQRSMRLIWTFPSPLPTLPFLTARYQYRDNSVPHKVSCDAKGPLVVKVTKGMGLGHGHLTQKVLCVVIEGPEALLGTELIALIFDSLQVAIQDLNVVSYPGRAPKLYLKII